MGLLVFSSLTAPLRGDDRYSGDGYCCSRDAAYIATGVVLGVALFAGMIAIIINENNHHCHHGHHHQAKHH